MKKVSVVIASYNRFDHLVEAIESIRKQSYQKIEIIVVNDCSSDERYYSNELKRQVKWIDLPKNSRSIFSFPSGGYVRNIGIQQAEGELIAILDDDDYFLPHKISTQVEILEKTNYRLCSSEGLIGRGIFNSAKTYPEYFKEYYSEFCHSFFQSQYGRFCGELPSVLNLDLIKRHNFILHSSLMYEKTLYDEVGGYDSVPNGLEDWGLLLKMLEKTDCYYIDTPLVYYDGRMKKESLVRRILKKLSR